jgi:hypothetical protein
LGKVAQVAMSDELILEDGRQWYAANWVVGDVLAKIADELSELGGAPVFCDWLRDKSQRCGGCIGFDLRGLSDNHRKSFYIGAHRAYLRLIANGPKGWNDPSCFSGFVEKVARLLTMKEHIDKGQPPNSLNDFHEAIGFDGEFLDLTDRWSG